MAAAVALDDTLGAILIGLVFAAILNGVTLVQAAYYFTHQNDPQPLRILAGIVIALDVLHQALITHAVYTYTITNWGDLAALQAIVWSNSVEALVNGLLAFCVQSFLAMRVWRFSNHNKVLTGVLALFIVGQFVLITTSTSFSFQVKSYAELAKYANLPIAVMALAVAGDVLITASLCALLHRSRTGFYRSDTVIDKLILFAVNTGLLPTVLAIAAMISLVTSSRTFINMAFFFSIGRAYTNCFLATLNTRKRIQASVSAVGTMSEDISLSKTDFSNKATKGSRRPANISIKIETKQELATDEQLDYNGDLEKVKRGSLGAMAC